MGKAPNETIIKKYGSIENYKKHMHEKLSGKHYYTNGIEDRKFSDNEEIPEGWYKGRTNCGKGTKGYIWINNGIEQKLIPGNSNIPEGWIIGALPFTDEHKNNLSKSLTGKTRTEKQKENIRKAHNTEEYKRNIENTMLEKYGVKNAYQIPEVRDKAIKNSQSEEAQQKRIATCNKHFNVDYPMQSEEVKQTLKNNNLRKYGVESVFQIPEVREQIKQTNLERYGVEYASQSNEIKEKIRKTNLERYGVECVLQVDDIKDKIKQSNINNRGVPYPLNDPEVMQKQIKTNLARYNVMYNIQLPQSYIGSSKNSKPNREFAALLDQYNIEYSREFSLDKYSFDFKIGDILIEINPSATHNSLWGPFGDHSGLDKDYHYKKSKCAESNGYRVIHIFDWDDKDIIIRNLIERNTIYARNTILCTLTTQETNMFLENNHLQGKCNGQTVCLGLKDKENNLLSVMTFGKPRFNKNYEYELLRYCSNSNIIGGAEKLFKNFINMYNPTSIISYCDKSKFTGDIYLKLGFTLKCDGKPTKHWYNCNEKLCHITDNLLRKRGYDQLFNANYGKGTSNEELIIERGYVPIYDCGQNTYVYINN